MQRCILVYNKDRDTITSAGAVKHIEEALKTLNYKVESIPFNREFLSLLRKDDLVFNYYTSTGLLQCLVPLILEWIGIPFTGSTADTQFLAMDKEYTSLVLKSYGIPVPPFSVITDIDKIGDIPPFPVIVKPALGGSSEGISDISVAENYKELKLALESLSSNKFTKILVSSFIEGEELTVGIIGKNTPTVIGILKTCIDAKQILTSKLKEVLDAYDERVVIYSESSYSKVVNVALNSYRILRCRGYARIDLRLNLEGIPYVIDVNTLPGLHPRYSYLPRMAEEYGLGYTGLIKAIVDSAFE